MDDDDDDDDLIYVPQPTREERDAIGFAEGNVIDLCGDSDEEAPAAPATAAATASGAPAAAGPIVIDLCDSDSDDTLLAPAQPPGKRVKMESGGGKLTQSVVQSCRVIRRPGMPTDGDPSLEVAGNDLPTDATGFSDLAPFVHAPARRAGHIVLKLSAAAAAGRPSHVAIGGDLGADASTARKVRKLLQLPDVRVDDGTEGRQLLIALEALSNPFNNPTREPLVRLEMQPPMPWRLERAAPAGATGSSSDAADGTVVARLDVFLEEAIFSLKISSWLSPTSCYHSIWHMMDQLVPARPPLPTPRPPPVKSGALFSTAGERFGNGKGRADAHAFTTPALMGAMESAGYDEMADPEGLRLELYSFQRQSLQWMYDREVSPGGLNALFWQEHPSDLGVPPHAVDGSSVDHTYWYNKMAGELRAEAPPVVSGGFLCEEMGLGKTCEMCALMLANKHSAAAVAAGRARKMRPGTYPPTPLPDVAATLVVVPQTLLTQWEAEVRKCTGAEAEGGLRVYQFHGPDRPSTGAAFEKAITGADVVLTTYAGHAST